MKPIDGKVAVVTGGTQGLGAAVARTFGWMNMNLEYQLIEQTAGNPSFIDSAPVQDEALQP